MIPIGIVTYPFTLFVGQPLSNSCIQKLSWWKASTDSMISEAMKSHTNEHTVRGGPTLKNVKCFRNGRSARLARDQFTSEHFVIFEWIYQESCYAKEAIHQLFNLIKSIFRSVIVNQVRSQHELRTSSNKSRKVREIRLCCFRVYYTGSYIP